MLHVKLLLNELLHFVHSGFTRKGLKNAQVFCVEAWVVELVQGHFCSNEVKCFSGSKVNFMLV